MPTPFMHLQFAEMLHSRLSQAHPINGRLLQQQLQENWPAFYLGSIAPDCCAIADVSRPATHFYDIPMKPADNPTLDFLQSLPQLDRPSPARRIFVAGYMAHLYYDVVWYWQVLVPWFFQQEWINRPSRRLVHFALLTHQDDDAWRSLPEQAGSVLLAAQPRRWLPFVSDAVLDSWRDMVGEQLAPGADKQTAVIYAQRLQLSPEIFSSYLDSPDWMAENVFPYAPLDELHHIVSQAVDSCAQLLIQHFC